MGASPAGAARAQLVLDFGERGERDLDGFEPGACGEALARLTQAAGAGSGTLYLSGRRGSGKSHLLLGLCRRAQCLGRHGVYAPLRELASVDAGVLDGLAQHGVVCVDDIDAVLGMRAWESALFRLWNECDAAGTLLAVAARAPPLALGVALPDLASRLRAALLLPLAELDDAGRLAALQRQARRRGFELPEAAAALLLRSLPRDMHSLSLAVADLDRASLARQRRVTAAFVREWLGEARAAAIAGRAAGGG